MGEGQRDILLTARFACLEPAAAEFLSASVNNPKVGLFVGLFVVIADNVDAGRAAEVKGAREVTHFIFRYISKCLPWFQSPNFVSEISGANLPADINRGRQGLTGRGAKRPKRSGDRPKRRYFVSR